MTTNKLHSNQTKKGKYLNANFTAGILALSLFLILNPSVLSAQKRPEVKSLLLSFSKVFERVENTNAETNSNPPTNSYKKLTGLAANIHFRLVDVTADHKIRIQLGDSVNYNGYLDKKLVIVFNDSPERQEVLLYTNDSEKSNVCSLNMGNAFVAFNIPAKQMRGCWLTISILDKDDKELDKKTFQYN